MISQPVASLLVTLDVAKSHSRPHVPDRARRTHEQPRTAWSSCERTQKQTAAGDAFYVNQFFVLQPSGILPTKHIFAGETRIVTKTDPISQVPMISCYSVPAPNTAIVESVLEGGRNGMLKNAKGAVLGGERWLVYDGWPALDVTLKSPTEDGPVDIRGRLLLVGRRFYVLVIAGTTLKSKPAVERFLSSLQVKKPDDDFRVPNRKTGQRSSRAT
jgi:hypothetical protein